VGLVRIDLSEVHALADDLRKAGDTMPAKAERVVAVGGHQVLARMRANTPVRTGRLKSSESDSESVDIVGLEFEAGPTAEYAAYVELGTSRMAAEPYAGPAFDQELPGIIDSLLDAGSRIL
jgi:HK97 gp10 family phage protein